MPITFNSILIEAGINPTDVRLVRHQDKRSDPELTPYLLWRDRNVSQAFMTYQARQSARSTKLLAASPFWAVFVVNPNNETLFAGLYAASNPTPGPMGVPQIGIKNAVEDRPYNVFQLEQRAELQEFVGTLVVEWGKGFLAWVQRAHEKEKAVVELRREFKEEDFPGYLRFMKPLSDIAGLPQGWITRLREMKGVYVLTCLVTKELYIGAATGAGGFYDRWLQHAAKSGDAVKFRSRPPGEYQVAILEIAGSNATERDILHAEQLWMKKLRTNEMGLNGGLIPLVKGLLT